MTIDAVLTPIRPQDAVSGSPRPDDMVWIPGGTFRVGSDNHYAEEAPVHSVTVDAFWIDRTPVTNRQFREFVRATGHVTFAEIAPDPKDYPGALPNMLRAGSLVFTPPKHPIEDMVIGASGGLSSLAPIGGGPTDRAAHSVGSRIIRSSRRLQRRLGLREWAGKDLRLKRNGGLHPRRARRRRVRLGQ